MLKLGAGVYPIRKKPSLLNDGSSIIHITVGDLPVSVRVAKMLGTESSHALLHGNVIKLPVTKNGPVAAVECPDPGYWIPQVTAAEGTAYSGPEVPGEFPPPMPPPAPFPEPSHDPGPDPDPDPDPVDLQGDMSQSYDSSPTGMSVEDRFNFKPITDFNPMEDT